MKPLPCLVGTVRVLDVRLAADGTHTCTVWRQSFRSAAAPAAASLAEAGKGASVVAVTGYGVMEKAADATGTVARVLSDPATFIAGVQQGRVRFVRRERMQPVLRELAEKGIYPQRICPGATVSEAARAFFGGLRWGALLRPEPASSAVLSALVRRLALPVLGLLFGTLAGNAAWAPRLERRRELLRQELSLREQTVSATASAGARQRELLEAFMVRPGPGRALLCDRIAAAVPAQVVLTTLEVEPLTKRFEAGKPLLRREGTIVVAGTAPSADGVSELARRLAAAGCFAAVRLVSMERQRDGGLLTFRIEASL